MRAKFKKKLVQGSMNYDELNLISFNRPAGVRKDIEESIRENGFTDEIKVVKTSAISGRNKLYIVDGQNRWFTARSMNHPFDYIIERETNDLQEIANMIVSYNSKQKPWRNSDYINLFIQFQNQDYITLKNIALKYDITLVTASNLLSGNFNRTRSTKDLKDGKFKISHKRKALQILDEIAEVKKIVSIPDRFIYAFAMFYLAEENYSRKKFLDRVKANVSLIKKVNEILPYYDLIKKIYSSK